MRTFLLLYAIVGFICDNMARLEEGLEVIKMVNARNSNLLGKITVLVVLLLISANSAVGKTIHVKVGGTGDGSSWLNAFGSLQAALDDAEPNDNIWVAEGTYTPTNEVGGTGSRYKTFQMKNYVGIYGGFPGTGNPNWEDRDWEKYETELSGDLFGNDMEVGDPCDLIDDPCRTDNGYHVLMGIELDPNAVIDGFVVTGGNADGSYPNNSGGGMYNYTGKTSLLITEIGTADPHFIEIQNLNNTSVNTSGWAVLLNDASFGINIVNSIGWFLPGSVAAGQVLYRTDNPGDNYWGSNIDWDTTGPGWAMIVDYTGSIIDFIVWGYSEAEIAALNIDFGGFVNISVGSAWSGDSLPFNHSGDYSFKRVGTNDNDSAIDFVLTTPHSRGEKNADLSTPFSSSPTVSNCTFRGNSAGDGGGIYNNNSSPMLVGCRFEGNSGIGGGGVHYEGGNSSVVDCVFEDNYSSLEGGGVQLGDHTYVTINNCVFRRNVSTNGEGGAINLDVPRTCVNLTDCIFIENVALQGGAIQCDDCSLKAANCQFIRNNTIGHSGGAICFEGGEEGPNTPILTNCMFIGNSSDSRGGGIYNEFFSIYVGNCLFRGNRANLGGAIWNEAYLETEVATISNCTFSDNIASIVGGGIYCESDYDNIHVSNCIMWGDTPDEIHAGIRPPLIKYSDVQGGWPGLGNIDTDPLFVDPNGPDNILGTEDDNLHLLTYSPCIDGGDPTGDYTDQTDMDGQERVLYDNVDIGADEVFPIAGDIDQDGDVDFKDYAYFCGHWLKGK